MLGNAHRYLLKTQPKPRKVPAELSAIRDEAVEVDAVHDRKARGLYGILTAFAEVVDDREAAASYIELRDKIFPPEQGLRVIQASFGDEAAEGKLVEERLDADDLALLKKLPSPEGKLSDVHKARLKAAAKLGELEQKKKELEGEDAEKETIKQADVLKARNGWIKSARALQSVIDVSTPTPAIRKRILGPLEEADAKTSRGTTARPTDEVEDEADEDEVDEPETPEGTPKPDADK